jgi:hypothetical protein
MLEKREIELSAAFTGLAVLLSMLTVLLSAAWYGRIA